jgi:hypothetical protein
VRRYKRLLESLFKTKRAMSGVNKSIDFDVCLSPVLDTVEVYDQNMEEACFRIMSLLLKSNWLILNPIKAIQVCDFFCVLYETRRMGLLLVI